VARTKAEIGALGLPLFAGYLSLEPDTTLRGAQGVRVFRRMMLDEPAAAAFLGAAYNLLRTDLSVNPGGTTDADKAAAEFLDECLLDMRESVGAMIRQMYSMLWAGWDIHELVYKRRSGGNGSRFDDGRVGWAAWALRRQDTLYRWQMDDAGRIDAFEQRPAPTYSLRTLPLSKCIHLVADDSDGSPEGKSCLRAMYIPLYFVKQLRLLYGISLERFGTGVPVWEFQDGAPDIDQAQLATIEAIIAGLRQNEEAGIITPKGMTFRFAQSPGLAANDYKEAIQFFQVWALVSALADFMALGTMGKGGSLALGQDKSELFLLALNGFQERLLSALNRQAVPRLFRYNDFGSLTALPELALPPVKRYDLAQLGAFAQVLSQIGAFHATPEDEEFLRKISDLPDLDLSIIQELHATAAAPAGQVQCPNCGALNSLNAPVCVQCGHTLQETGDSVPTGQDTQNVAAADDPTTDAEEVDAEDSQLIEEEVSFSDPRLAAILEQAEAAAARAESAAQQADVVASTPRTRTVTKQVQRDEAGRIQTITERETDTIAEEV
jgi:hypothetical protein